MLDSCLLSVFGTASAFIPYMQPMSSKLSAEFYAARRREESDARVILNPADVKLRSFNTQVAPCAWPLCNISFLHLQPS